MTPEEFTIGFERLCRGHQATATPERGEATYRAIEKYPRAAWEYAVDSLLMDPRMPNRERLLAAIEAAGEHLRRTAPPPFSRYAERHGGKPPPDDEPPHDPVFGKARLQVIADLAAKRHTRAEHPDKLLDLADRFPAYATSLVRAASHFAEEWGLSRAASGSPPEHIADAAVRAPEAAQLDLMGEASMDIETGYGSRLGGSVAFLDGGKELVGQHLIGPEAIDIEPEEDDEEDEESEEEEDEEEGDEDEEEEQPEKSDSGEPF